MRVFIVMAGLFLTACQSVPAAPAADARPIVLGQGHDVASSALGEVRRLNVYLPPGYATGEQRYPVLYLVDGGVDQDFIHIAGLSQHATISGSFREMIVVGVETKDRRRELTFPAVNDATLRRDYPTHGESAKFRAFLADEVKSWVERRYRTDGHDAIMGESLAGLFVVETFLKQPGLFDGYVAIDPSLWWDKEQLSREAPGLFANPNDGKQTLFMAIADSGPEMRLGQVQMATAVRNAARADLEFIYEPMLDEQHSTIYHRAALMAWRRLFANVPQATK